jgi:hypothetical protein
LSNHLRARVSKDMKHPGRLLPWQVFIEGQLTVTFPSQEAAYRHAIKRVTSLRQELETFFKLELVD